MSLEVTVSRPRISKPQVAQIGLYPPPYGGVSIHIQRLKEQLEKNGCECVVYDLGGEGESVERNVIRIGKIKRRLLRCLIFTKEDVIHCHISNWKMRVMMGLMGFIGKKTVISIHGTSINDSLRKGSWLRRQITGFAFKNTSYIIAVNPKIRELVISLGARPERVEVIPAFIPPAVRKEEIAEIPQEVWSFITSHSPIISANAFRIRFYTNQDLYGIDMCIDLCGNLKGDYPHIGFVFSLPDIGDYDYFNSIKRRIKEKGIEDNFLFQTKPCQFYPILMKSDVFVRPTNTDGDAVSLREALHFKVPSVASDVVPRPEGTILFKNRDLDDFTSKVRSITDNYELHKKKLEMRKPEDNFKKILTVYQKLTAMEIIQ